MITLADRETEAVVDAMIEALWPEVEKRGVSLNEMFAESGVEADNPSVLALLLIWCETAKKVGMDKRSAMILLEKFFESSDSGESDVQESESSPEPSRIIKPF